MRLIIFCSFVVFCYAEIPNYYWRDYYGHIPEDAFEAGVLRNGLPTYVGQALVKDHGILVGQIYFGEKTLTAYSEGIHNTTLYNKILCSQNKDNFQWLSVDAETLHLSTINQHKVVGGIESGLLLNVGRAVYHHEVVIGKVFSHSEGNALLYFPYNGTEASLDSYEILIYDAASDSDDDDEE